MNINILDYQDEKVVTSLQIAENLQLEIRSIDRLISKYIDKLELFGVVRFQITPLNKKVYFLNENQALFLGTLSKNTELVVEFKNTLVKAFSNIRNLQPIRKLSTLELLKEAVGELERLEGENSDLKVALMETETLALDTRKVLEHKQSIIVDLAEKVPPKTMRAKINEVVKTYASKNHITFSHTWNELYKQFKYIHSIDLQARTKKSGKSKMDEAEKANRLEELYLLTLKMYEID